MAKSAVTIKDLARMLGLSKSTVSRALTGHGDIHPETRKRVLELAAKLDYHPNAVAVNLKQQRTNTIGVLIPDTVNRFFAKAVGGIQHVATLAGYNIIICQSNESYTVEKRNVQTLLASRVDGLLVSVSQETDHYEHFQNIISKGIPVVFFDRIVEELAVSQVHSNNYEVSLEATLHLARQGCKRIAFVAGPKHLYNSRNRFRGYVDALKAAGLSYCEQYVVQSDFRLNRTADLARYLMSLKEKPDAIFAINDLAALEMMHVIKQLGYRIPNDVAILGYNNEAICKYVDPPLSSIEHPADKLGASAAEVLLNQINNSEWNPVRICIESKLVVRGSTFKGVH